MKKYALILSALFLSGSAGAQNNTKPCAAPEARQFDFWQGSWDLYVADTLAGNNTVYTIMDGCTTQENFSSPGYTGKSWSVYSPQLQLWQQTWIDSQGGFIYLTGKFENGKMTLTTEPKKLPNGKEIINHMVYYNITAKSFDWDWESTTDNGQTWKNNWRIHYVRKVNG